MGLNFILQVDARKAGRHIESHKQVNFSIHLHVFLIQTKCCMCYPFQRNYAMLDLLWNMWWKHQRRMKLHRQLHISSQGLQVTLSLRQTDLLTLTLTLTPTLGRDRYLSRQMKRLIQFRRYRHVDLYGYDSRNKEFTKLWQLAGTGSGPGITGKTDSLAIKFAQGFTATDC